MITCLPQLIMPFFASKSRSYKNGGKFVKNVHFFIFFVDFNNIPDLVWWYKEEVVRRANISSNHHKNR